MLVIAVFLIVSHAWKKKIYFPFRLFLCEYIHYETSKNHLTNNFMNVWWLWILSLKNSFKKTTKELSWPIVNNNLIGQSLYSFKFSIFKHQIISIIKTKFKMYIWKTMTLKLKCSFSHSNNENHVIMLY